MGEKLTGEARMVHQTVNLLPSAVAFARSLKRSDLRVKDVRSSDALNIIHILADVAEHLAREKYGKPRFRVPAGRAALSREEGR